ncbi:hypothetical protein LAZ67_22001479 [Cordylochernes scorpioides]|uniref:Uncharacterized protein n=1 Tax=Cordylochernes scorpioides TaxID=51811 RepID=A0ABY6LSX7_9ARAC|nr:hypothetical protein LAZ67_22001479 [Cordylochernes scorpioides]
MGTIVETKIVTTSIKIPNKDPDRRTVNSEPNVTTNSVHSDTPNLHQEGQCVDMNLEHPAYSPDLAPSDYFLFGLLKKELEGRRFDSDEDVQKVICRFNSQAAQRNLPRSSSPYPGRGRPMTRRRYSRSPDRTPSRSPHRDVQEN